MGRNWGNSPKEMRENAFASKALSRTLLKTDFTNIPGHRPFADYASAAAAAPSRLASSVRTRVREVSDKASASSRCSRGFFQ